MSCSELLREFALEPSLLNNWQNFRYYHDKFGVEEGRLISRFPKRWKRMVYDSLLPTIGEIERKRIEDRLSVIDAKMINMHREYDGNDSWLVNAVQSHDERPFHAIIASENPDEHTAILCSEDVDEQNELWRCDREMIVPRDPASLASILQNLFQISKEILFVDPHFGPEAGRFRITLQHYLEVASRTGNRFTRIEYHLQESSTNDFFTQECNGRLPQVIPDGQSILFKRWRQMEQGEQLHPRYILTDRGGLRFEGGLDAGQVGETIDVSILSASMYQQRWNDFQDATAAFELIDQLLIEGERRI